MLDRSRGMHGAAGLTKRGHRTWNGMDPLASYAEPKHAVDSSQTPYFGYWFFARPFKAFGQSLNVMDKDDLDNLFGATVKM